MLTPLGSLVTTTWSFFQKHMMVILIGAVIFGLIQGVMQSNLQINVSQHMGTVMGIDPQKFQDLSMRAAQGDTEAIKELDALSKDFGNKLGGTTEEAKEAAKAAVGMQVLGNVLPMFGIVFLITIVLQMIAISYYSVISVKGIAEPAAALTESFKYIFPLLGLWIWTGIRSFSWIPIIGFIFGIVLGPRFIAGPILLIRDGKSIMDSATDSFKATGGHWAKIFGNMFCVGIGMAIISVIIMKILSPIGLIGLCLSLIVQQAFIAFGVAFSIELSKTILENKNSMA